MILALILMAKRYVVRCLFHPKELCSLIHGWIVFSPVGWWPSVQGWYSYELSALLGGFSYHWGSSLTHGDILGTHRVSRCSQPRGWPRISASVSRSWAPRGVGCCWNGASRHLRWHTYPPPLPSDAGLEAAASHWWAKMLAFYCRHHHVYSNLFLIYDLLSN